MKKVSIIIPTYGGSVSLKRAINSMIGQDYENYDIIVVDDNNPGTEARKRTEAIMNEYKSIKKIIYLQHEKNMNGSAARNTGAKYSNADYLCFVDDDDVSFSTRITEQVKYLEEHSEYAACYCWCINHNKEVTYSMKGNLTKSLLDLTFSPQTSTIMIRHAEYDTLNGFDESYMRHQDYEFLLRFYKKYSIGVVEKVLVKQMTNEINNQLRGKKLFELKKYFFNHFGNIVDDLDRYEHGYKKHVYAAHFSAACKELIRYGNFYLAVKMYVMYGYIGGVEFWKRLLFLSTNGIKKKILKFLK